MDVTVGDCSQMLYWSVMVYRVTSAEEEVCYAQRVSVMISYQALHVYISSAAQQTQSACMLRPDTARRTTTPPLSCQGQKVSSSVTMTAAMRLYNLHSFELFWEKALDTKVGGFGSERV